MIAKIKNMGLENPKKLYVSWQFDLELILHQTSLMSILGGYNLIGVLQKDNFF